MYISIRQLNTVIYDLNDGDLQAHAEFKLSKPVKDLTPEELREYLEFEIANGLECVEDRTDDVFSVTVYEEDGAKIVGGKLDGFDDVVKELQEGTNI